MLSTTLPLYAVKTNVGTTAVTTVVGDREVYLGESQSVGSRRAIIDVMSGSGAWLANTVARLEREAAALADAELFSAAEELGIDLAA